MLTLEIQAGLDAVRVGWREPPEQNPLPLVAGQISIWLSWGGPALAIALVERYANWLLFAVTVARRP